MKIVTTSALMCALLLGPGLAQDVTYPWSSVSFRVPLKDGVAAVHLEGTETLTKVLLTMGGVAQEVPTEELEGLDSPRLDSARVLFGKGWYGAYVEGEEATPHTLVELSYGELSKFGGFTTVRFLFHGGKYQSRITLVRKSTTEWVESEKPVGEEPFEIGTVTRPAPAPGPPPVK